MLLHPHRRQVGLSLILAGVFAVLWAIARASVQSVTMDEANTYLSFVNQTAPFQWFAFPNNHILNSAMMRMFTTIFGVSHLTVRLPALIGGAVYVGVSLYVCTLLPARLALRLPLFLCLVYNPFVFDFLVAARGYGWAMALLLCAVVVPAASLRTGASPLKACAACSLLVAFSFTSNFSFAFADFAVLLMVFLWIWRERGFSLRLLAAAIVPAVLVIVMLPLPVLLQWPPGQLYAGAMSLRQTFGSVIHWSLYEINPEVANTLMVQIMQRLEHRLFPVLGSVVLWRLVLLLLHRGNLRGEQARWLASLAAVLAGAAGLATILHWAAFHAFGLFLPLDRTALFYVPLCTLAVGITMAIPVESRAGLVSYWAGVSVFVLFALHFMFSMRLTYFGEWRYDADMNKVYGVLASYNHNDCIDRVASNWVYTDSLNFYRAVSGRESFPAFPPGFVLPEDAQAYVLHANKDWKFIEDQKLTVVFHGESTDAVIAVRSPLVRCSQ